MRRLAVALALLALGALAPAAQAATPGAARAAAERVLTAGGDLVTPQPHGFGAAARRHHFRPVVAIHKLKRALPASETGPYTASVNATADDGNTASASGSMIVSYPAPGTCPPP